MTDATDLAAAFKAAMRRLAATVTIVSNREPETGRRSGMTATAVTSLSADPPSLLVCVNRQASMHASLTEGSPFCVNILGQAHADLARSFGGRVEPELRFEEGDWAEDQSVPYLADAVATLFCTVDALVDYATHSIVIGLVTAVHVHEHQQPLIYGNGRFALMGDVF